MTNYPGNANTPGYPPGGGRRGASFDLRALMPGGLLVLAGGLLYFVFSFFPWYTVDFCGDFNVSNAYGFSCSVSANAWDRGVATFSVILFLIAALAYLLKGILAHAIPPNIPLELIALGVVVLGDIFFLISFFNTQGTSRGWGLWVALVLFLVINVGAVLSFVKAGGIRSARGRPGLQQGPPAGYQQGPPAGYQQQGPPAGYQQQPPRPGGYQPPPSAPGQGGYPPGQGGYPPQQPR